MRYQGWPPVEQATRPNGWFTCWNLASESCPAPGKNALRLPLDYRVGASWDLECCASTRRRGLPHLLRDHFPWCFKAVGRLQVISGQNQRRKHSSRRFVLPIHFEYMRFGQIPVKNEEGDSPVVGLRTDHIQVRDLAYSRHFVCRRLSQDIQHRAASVIERPAIRVINRL